MGGFIIVIIRKKGKKESVLWISCILTVLLEVKPAVVFPREKVKLSIFPVDTGINSFDRKKKEEEDEEDDDFSEKCASRDEKRRERKKRSPTDQKTILAKILDQSFLDIRGMFFHF